MSAEPDELIDLLDEWFQWWTGPEGPAKMPNALHVRTAIALLSYGRDPRFIPHDSDFECEDCGGPSPPTSTSGCQFCDSQGNIVPRGQAKRRTWVPAVLSDMRSRTK